MTTVPTWTPELIEEAIAMYIERIEGYPEDQRPDVTTEVTQGIADELGFKLNSVRARLAKAKRPDGGDVYVRKVKAKTASTATGSGTGTGGKRVSKADAQAALIQALKTLGAEVADELTGHIEKMTGKCAQALADSLTNIED